MSVHPMEIQMLKFTDQERAALAPSFMFGDAETILSFAVSRFGSERVTTLIVETLDQDIAMLALTEVDGFSEADKDRIRQILKR